MLQVVRNYMGADAATRESRKMGMMLTGAVVGLAPVTANVLIGLVSPSTFIPTSQYWFLALAAIPITFALAAVHGSAAAMATAGATAPQRRHQQQRRQRPRLRRLRPQPLQHLMSSQCAP